MDRSGLIPILEAYLPADPAEALSRIHMLELLADPHAQDCFYRTRKAGHLTGSALLVGFGGEKALLMHHKKLDRWLNFGGHADGDEDLLRVALRETQEESGIHDVHVVLRTPLDLDVHPIPARPEKDEPEHFHYDVRYLLYTPQTAFAMQEEEVNDLRWCDPAEAQELVGDDLSMQRILKKWRNSLPLIEVIKARLSGPSLKDCAGAGA